MKIFLDSLSFKSNVWQGSDNNAYVLHLIQMDIQ